MHVSVIISVSLFQKENNVWTHYIVSGLDKIELAFMIEEIGELVAMDEYKIHLSPGHMNTYFNVCTRTVGTPDILPKNCRGKDTDVYYLRHNVDVFIEVQMYTRGSFNPCKDDPHYPAIVYSEWTAFPSRFTKLSCIKVLKIFKKN